MQAAAKEEVGYDKHGPEPKQSTSKRKRGKTTQTHNLQVMTPSTVSLSLVSQSGVTTATVPKMAVSRRKNE